MKKLRSVLAVLCLCLMTSFCCFGLSGCKKKQALSSSMVSLESYEYVYDGTEKRPQVTVTVKNKTIKSSNYTVQYSDNINVGTATVTVTAKKKNKKISGKASVQFEIVQSGLTGELTFENREYNGQNQKPQIPLDGLTENDYTVAWEYKGVFDEDFAPVSGEEFISAGQYRATVTGKGNYSGVATGVYTIERQAIEEPAVSGEYYYTGEPLTIVLSYESTLFDVTDNVQTRVGQYTLTVTLKDKANYVWKNSASDADLSLGFEILPSKTDGLEVTIDESQYTFTGSEITPEVTVTLDGRTLEIENDYRVSYSDNTNVGTATILVEGINNYNFAKELHFEILALEVEKPRIIGSYEYSGESCLPVLSQDSELYELLEGEFIEAGTHHATVRLTDKQNYVWTGTNSSEDLDLEFTIAPKSIASASITFYGGEQRYTGSALTPTARVTVGLLLLVQDTDFDINYSNNTEVGTATVEVIAKGNFTGRKISSFSILPMLLEAPVISGTYTYNGQEQSAQLSYTSDLFTFESESYVDAGTYDITVSLKNKTNYAWSGQNNSDDLTLKFVIEKKNISGASITLNEDEFVYSGDAFMPTVTLVTVDSLTLDASKDYSVSYTNNTDAGTAYAVIEGKGNFTGTARKSFTIAPQTVTKPTVLGSYTYNGNEQTCRLSYSSNLFTVTGNKQKDAGTYYVVVSLVNNKNYTWEDSTTIDLRLRFVINKANYEGVTVSRAGYNYKDAPTEILLSKQVYGDVKYYAYTVSRDTDSREVTSSTVLDAGTYHLYAEILQSKNYNGFTTAEITFEVAKADISNAQIVLESEVYDYTGLEIFPEFTVELDNKVLLGKDYSVSYENNTALGTATITVTGQGNYTGTVKKNFMIVKGSEPCEKHTEGQQVIEGLQKATLNKDGGYDEVVHCTICGAVISTHHVVIDKIDKSKIHVDVTEVTYNGHAHTKTVTSDYELDTDYRVSYLDNTQAGTAKVVLTFIGNYDDVIEYEFEILPIKVAQPEIVGSYTYTGEEQTVTLSDISSLYNVYDNTFVDAGEHIVRVSLVDKRNYEWETQGNSEDLLLTFVVAGKDLSEADCQISPATKEFTGSELTVGVTVTLEGTQLVLNRDFELEFSKNTYVGQADILVSGINNYSGSLTAHFTITKRQVDDPVFEQSYEYNEIENIFADNPLYSIGSYSPAGDGKVSVSVQLNDTENYMWRSTGNSEPLTFEINIQKGMVPEPEISGNFVYNGQPHTALTETEYYTVTNATQTAAGRYNVTVSLRQKDYYVWQGQGTSDDLTLEMVIEQANISQAEFTLNQTEYQYSGDAIMPDFTLSFAGITLVEEGDFTVVISGNVDAGLVTVQIRGNGNFTGTREFSFTILPQTVTVPSAQNADFDGKEHIALEGNNIYSVINGTYTLAGKYKVTLSFINKNNYIWSTTRSNSDISIDFEIYAANISEAEVTLISESFEYTGKNITDVISSVVYGDYTLQADDYELRFEGNQSVGNAVVTLVGKKNFTGEQEVSFKITPMIVQTPVIEGTFTYNGNPQSPGISSNYYTLSQSEFTDAGTHEITVSLVDKNNCIWSESQSNADLVLSFIIQKCSLEKPQISGEYKFNGKNQTAVLSNMSSNIVVEGNEQINAGTHKITISLVSENFIWTDGETESYQLDFVIEKAQIGDTRVVLEQDKIKFEGEPLTPGVTIRLGDYELVPDSDYSLSYSGNDAVGRATITITGNGNFEGTTEVTFEIISSDVLDMTIVLSSQSANYSGEDLRPTFEVFYGDQKLTEENYTFYWQDESLQNVNYLIDAGMYTLYVTGTGNFTNSAKAEFVINKIHYDEITVTRDSYTYGGVKPLVKFSLDTVTGDIVYYYSLTDSKDSLVEFKLDDELDAGKYYLFVKINESKNYYEYMTETGAEFEVYRAQRTGIFVSREGYEFGNPSEIVVSGIDIEELGDAIKFYYYAEGSDKQSAQLFDRDFEFGVGTFYFYAVIDEDKNHEGFETDVASFTVSPISYEGISVSRDSYTYGEETEIVLHGYSGDEQYVKFYYNTLDTNTDGTELTSETVLVCGVYYVYAVISGHENYAEYVTETCMFEVTKATYKGIFVQRESYQYGDSRTEITLSGQVFGRVTYFYNTEESNSGGTQLSSDTVLDAGTYYIYAQIEESENYNAFVTEVTQFSVYKIRVTKPEVTDKTFTGMPQSLVETNPNFTVLEESTVMAAGEYQITLSLTDKVNSVWDDNDSTEDIKITINIRKADMKSVSVTLNETDFTYNGEEKQPTFIAMLGQYRLIESDMQVSYLSNRNAGTAQIRIVGDGNNFEGEQLVDFEIKRADYSVTIEANSVTYGTLCEFNLSAPAEGNVVYYISQSENDGFEVFNISELLDAGDYFVKIIIEESQNYNRYETAAVAFSVNKADMTLTQISMETKYSYIGEDFEAEISGITIGEYVLQEGIDYILTITKDGEETEILHDVGTYIFEFVGQGNFIGSVQREVVVAALDFNDAVITIEGGTPHENGNVSFDFTGESIAPDITVKIGNIELHLGVDYRVEYNNNTNPGTAEILVIGINAYSGQKTVYFDIVIEKKSIENAVVSQSNFELSYSGTNQSGKVSFTVSVEGKMLQQGVDYIVTWETLSGRPASGTYFTDADTYTGTITAIEQGNYYGEAITKITVIITPKTIRKSDVKLSADSATYTGGDVTPEITVTSSGTVLIAGVDYTVTIRQGTQVVTEIKDPGTYRITITFKGNYTGSQMLTFTVSE